VCGSPTSRPPVQWRAARRLLLVSVCLTLALAGRPAAGLGIEFWHLRAFQHRAVLRVDKVHGATDAYAEIDTRHDPAAGLPTIAVVDAAGTRVPFKLMAIGPGDRLVVAFRTTQLVVYYVYFDLAPGRSIDPPPEPEWAPRSGVLLRTYAWGLDQPDLDTLDGLNALVRASTDLYGGGYRDTIFDGANPFGPSDRYTSVYTASLRIGQPGRYEFATNSDDASALYVDGKPVAQYLGRHGPYAPGGQHNGAVELDAGVHTLDYLHAEDRVTQACVAGWKKPGDESFALIAADAVVPIVHAQLKRYEHHGGTAPDFRARVDSVYTTEDGRTALIGVTFEASPGGMLAPRAYRWSFGDGETAVGKTAEHVFFVQGVYPVVLEIDDRRGPTRTVRHWVGAWHLEERNTRDPEKTRADFEQIISTYSLAKHPTPALEAVCAFYRMDPAKDADRMRLCEALIERFKASDPARAIDYSLELAALHEKLGGWRTADARRAVFESVLAMAPTDAQKAGAHIGLGELALFYDHKPAAAIEHFEAVQRLECPSDVRRLALIRIGDARVELGEIEAARAAYRSVPVSPSDRRNEAVLSEAYGLSVTQLLAGKDADAALETINTWEWRLPEVKLTGYSSLLSVRVALAQQRPDEAAKFCRLIIDKLSDDANKPEAYSILIRLLLDAGERVQAAKRFDEFQERFPLSPYVRDLRTLLGQ
jgi:tetratricopeptide (TPR) repeat protein